MLRVEVSEVGQPPLPAVDVDGDFVIGSAGSARIRLPAGIAKPEHARVVGDHVDGRPIGDGITLEIGNYRVRLGPAPAGAVATPPQRTESLARELLRGLVGAPTLEVERGPVIGARRALAPPESVLVIGRGDEAGWVILDEDLSKQHAEIRRNWDGVRVVDLDSKNGTKLDGALVREAELHDGARLELGAVTLRYRDPAEPHARNEPARSPVPAMGSPASRVPFYVAVAIMAVALAGLVWVVTS